MKRGNAAGLATGLILLAGCSAGSPPSTTGALVGGIYYCGGITAGQCPSAHAVDTTATSVRGTVIVSLAGRTVRSISLRRGEAYRLHLTPGRYLVSTDDQSALTSTRAVVHSGQTTVANVIISIP